MQVWCLSTPQNLKAGYVPVYSCITSIIPRLMECVVCLHAEYNEVRCKNKAGKQHNYLYISCTINTIAVDPAQLIHLLRARKEKNIHATQTTMVLFEIIITFKLFSSVAIVLHVVVAVGVAYNWYTALSPCMA